MINTFNSTSVCLSRLEEETSVQVEVKYYDKKTFFATKKVQFFSSLSTYYIILFN